MRTRGQIIRAAREAKGYSQEDMAIKVNLTQQAYSDIERDATKNPRRKVLQVISKELDIPIETLLLGEDWPTSIPEEVMVLAREYLHATDRGKIEIMAAIIKDRQRRDATQAVTHSSA